MDTLLIVSATIVLVFAAYALLAPLAMNFGRFSQPFHVPCPECTVEADVEVKATRAALGAAYGLGNKALQVRRCSLLPKGETCDGACLDRIAA